jgi:hypothetical protein
VQQLTKADFLEKYGAVEVTFSSYYKYTFDFTATLPDENLLTVRVGGGGDDIYRQSVTANTLHRVDTLAPYAGSVTQNGVELEEFYEHY